nr:hypothetical protein [Tanacetum cinerariifolium]
MCDPQIPHLLDPSSAFGGSVGGAGTRIEIKKRLQEREIHQQESLSTDDTKLEPSLVTEGIKLDAKQSTIDSSTSSEQQNECNSSRNECSKSGYENRSSNNKSSSLRNDVDADIRHSYNSDTVSKNNSNIISDIQNMDTDRDNEEHDYVDDEQQRAFFASLINNLKCDVEKCMKINHEAQQANALLTKELERYKVKKHFAKETTIESEYCKNIKLLNEFQTLNLKLVKMKRHSPGKMESLMNIYKSSTEYTEDNSNDEDNEDSHSAEEEQNTEDSDSVKKRGRPKKIVRANENKSSSVKRRGRPKKSNDKLKKQTIGSNRKGREYKEEDDDDNDGTKRMKKKMYHKEAKLLYLHCTKFDNFDVIHQISAIKHWKSVQMKHREKIEIEKYGRFGMLPKKEALNLQSEDYIKMIKEKYYNIHQDLISVREKLDEGLSRFPDSKKLNMFREKFEETTTGIDNDDTTGIDKESYSPDCQMESDSPASDDDNQKSNFQVLFHKESGNFDLQRMKNKDRNEDVDHILNEDDKVDDSCPAAGFCSVIEGDEVILSEVEDVEKEKQQIGNEEDRVVDDSVERSEHTIKILKKKISNEELRSEILKG